MNHNFITNLHIIESFEKEVNEWYTSLPSCPLATIDQLRNIAHCVVENLDDFLWLPGSYFGILFEEVESLKGHMAFLINFINFATFLRTYHRELFAQYISLAFSAAHFTVHLFSATHYSSDVFITDSRASSVSISALLLRINPSSNHLLCDIYTQALESIKSSVKRAKVPFVYPADDGLIVMKDFVFLLLSTLWDMLQFLETCSLLVTFKDKLEYLYKELQTLRTLLDKLPDKFDRKIFCMTRDTILDAGFLIFSIYEKDFNIDLGFQEFQENIRGIRKLVLKGEVVQTSDGTVLAFLDFLLDYLTSVPSPETNSDTHNYVTSIREDLVFLRSFMEKVAGLWIRQEDHSQVLWNLALEVAYQIELLIDQLVVGDIQHSSSTFQSIGKDMLIIRTDSMNLFDDIKHDIRIQEFNSASTDQVHKSKVSSRSNSPTTDVVVGFGKEKSSVIDRLTRGSEDLQVVSIVGMPGLGKTTLAMQVYNDMWYHFHVRTWCSISQVFDQRKVLLELLNNIQPRDRSTDSIDDLAHELKRSLLQGRYLIFMDDVWDIEAYECLKESFPNNSTGSRILLTSRRCDIVPEALFLPHLTSEESLELLRKKIFPGQRDWPPEIHEFGKEVAEYCKGLPLTIVLVAGILTSKRQEHWVDILKSLRSGTLSTSDQCVDIIELSYKHLPHHLKPCFLSFGIFQEDEVVFVKQLICLWIAEGFVRTSESKILEEVAREYLNDLIGRCLVMKAKEGSRGSVKACRIHDLLHDFCLRKTKEQDAVFNVWNGQDDHLSYDGLGNIRRLCIHSGAENLKMSKLYCPRLRSLLFCRKDDWEKNLKMPFIFRIFKLLRVLAMERVGIAHFPRNIEFLVHLQYLAIQVERYISPSIGKLVNLETLILSPTKGSMMMPDTIWNLQKLRYLFFDDGPIPLYIFFDTDDLDSSDHCLNLDSASWLYFKSWNTMKKLLKRLTNIRRLKCRLDSPGEPSMDMSLTFLSQLESLTLWSCLKSSMMELVFPDGIKKLSLEGCRWSWTKISRIAELPNLEVLKLLENSFIGDLWHVEEGNFSKLKTLMLVSLDIVKWTALDDSFPDMEKIVLDSCNKLEEIPECLENMVHLKKIEVQRCTDHVEMLVRKVENYQVEMGNSDLQVDVRDTVRVFTDEMGSDDNNLDSLQRL